MGLLNTARYKRCLAIVYLSCTIKFIYIDDSRNMYNIGSPSFLLLRVNYLLNY